jgi:hypothetical protein
VGLLPSLKPYPDELLFIVLCRQWRRTPFSLFKFKRFLHTKTNLKQPLYHTCHPIFPVRIDEYCAKLNQGFLSPETVVEHHTVLPYYRPFVSDHTYQRLLTRSGVGGHSITDHFKGHPIQYCPSCVREDLSAKPAREPYLRNLHQIQGYLVCHRHNEWLKTLPVIGQPRRHGYQFDALDGLSPKSSARQPAISSTIATLAQDIASIPETFKGVQSEKLWTAMAHRLFSQGRRKELSKQAKADLRKTVSSVPGLKLTRHGHTISCYQKQFFPIVVPLFDILIRYLGETPASFVQLISSGKTRRERFPCLNSSCAHYDQDVIEDSRNLLPGTHYFIFTCPHCGFAYGLTKWQLRKLNQVGVKAVHEMAFVVYSLDKTLMPQFRLAWNDPQVSYQSLLKRFPLKRVDMCRMALLQGMLEHNRRGRGDNSQVREFLAATARTEARIQKRRQILLDALEKNPDLLVFNDAMPRKIKSAFQSLYLNDPGWMTELRKKRLAQAKKSKLGK